MEQESPWGQSAAIDLADCAHDRLADSIGLKGFIRELVTVIGMVPHGECLLERFGGGELKGYSAMQFIETSSITMHCDEVRDRVFIDVFSCKNFDAAKAAEFSRNYFQAKQVKFRELER